jgi:hypothetical protein
LAQRAGQIDLRECLSGRQRQNKAQNGPPPQIRHRVIRMQHGDFLQLVRSGPADDSTCAARFVANHCTFILHLVLALRGIPG